MEFHDKIGSDCYKRYACVEELKSRILIHSIDCGLDYVEEIPV